MHFISLFACLFVAWTISSFIYFRLAKQNVAVQSFIICSISPSFVLWIDRFRDSTISSTFYLFCEIKIHLFWLKCWSLGSRHHWQATNDFVMRSCGLSALNLFVYNINQSDGYVSRKQMPAIFDFPDWKTIKKWRKGKRKIKFHLPFGCVWWNYFKWIRFEPSLMRKYPRKTSNKIGNFH